MVKVSPFQSAELNRHEVEDERALRETSSDPLGPEFCVGRWFSHRASRNPEKDGGTRLRDPPSWPWRCAQRQSLRATRDRAYRSSDWSHEPGDWADQC